MKKTSLYITILIALYTATACANGSTLTHANARKIAQEEGITGDSLAYIQKALSDMSDKGKPGSPIESWQAYTLIAKHLIYTDTDRPAANDRLSEFDVTKLLNPRASLTHSEQFHILLQEARGLQQKITGSSCEAAKNRLAEINRLLPRLRGYYTSEIEGASTTPWFLSDDLLWRSLATADRDTHIQTSDVHGPIFTSNKDGIPLTRLKLKNRFVHVISSNQITNSCGFASVANAKAITDQLQKGKPITTERTRELAEQTLHRLPGLLKQADDMIQNDGTAGAYGLPARYFQNLKTSQSNIQSATATHVALFAEKVLELSPRELEIFDHTTAKDRFKQLLEGKQLDANDELSFKLSNQQVTHIIYDIGGHWVLLSVVKEGKTFSCYFLDSRNKLLDSYDEVTLLLDYIDALTNPDFYKNVTTKKNMLEAPRLWLEHNIATTKGQLEAFLNDHKEWFDDTDPATFNTRINGTDSAGNTLLHRLVTQGLTSTSEVYTYLVNQGIDATLQNNAGQTCQDLELACQARHKKQPQQSLTSKQSSWLHKAFLFSCATIAAYMVKHYIDRKRSAKIDEGAQQS